MPSQLQLNQGPQDALLYDNTRSYFTNVGYVRTSNFQMELKDIDPQNSASLGSTVQFIIPKAADLLGPCDLMIDFTTAAEAALATLTAGESAFVGWVESLGHAMIDKIVFSVGSHDIETITGDQLYITNELMRSDEHRLGKEQVLKTGRPLVRANVASVSGQSTGQTTDWDAIFPLGDADSYHNRIIAASYFTNATSATQVNKAFAGAKLIIPLGLFFTKHPSQYFPICSIAGCNDVRISVKLRPLHELLVLKSSQTTLNGVVTDAAAQAIATSAIPSVNVATGGCKLRCHYVHVTGPEANLLMNKEHVRLLKLWQNHNETKTIKHSASPSLQTLFDFELPFLHPVQEIIIVIRKVNEMQTELTAATKPSDDAKGARTHNYFAFHGGGKDPNIESQRNTVREAGTSNAQTNYLTVDNFKLTLNGQERHPSLSSTGIDRNYLMNRIMPMMHSNTSTYFGNIASSSYYKSSNINAPAVPAVPFPSDDFNALAEMMDRKEIYVYPFALNPEGANPSGAVNFSKVSHAKLRIEGLAHTTKSASTELEYRCDVWGVHYNWLQVKDGRALTSFA
jgi:hypothetical protein